MCDFIVQLVESIAPEFADVTGSNPVEAQIIFRLLPANCLNWITDCVDHSSQLQPQFQYELYHIYFKTLANRYDGLVDEEEGELGAKQQWSKIKEM